METLVSDGPGLACLRHRDSRDSPALLPTTPFMLLAAALFARPPRFHGWLLAHPWFGPHPRLAAVSRHSPPRQMPRHHLLHPDPFSVSLLVVPLPWSEVAAGCHNGDPAHLVDASAGAGAGCNEEVKSLSYRGNNAMELARHFCVTGLLLPQAETPCAAMAAQK